MKRLGSLVYFDIVLLFIFIRPIFLLLKNQGGILEYMPTVCIAAEIIFFMIYLFAKEPAGKLNMTKYDIRLWKITRYILYACGIGYFLSLTVITPFYIISLLFYLSILWYWGVQAYFLISKKW